MVIFDYLTLRQETLKCKASLGYMGNSRSAWATQSFCQWSLPGLGILFQDLKKRTQTVEEQGFLFRSKVEVQARYSARKGWDA